MATLNAVILPAKALKGGRHKIRISLAHNGETRYIVTDIVLDSAKEFKNGSIIKRPDASILNTKLRGLLQKYQNTINSIEYINGLSCPELVFELKNDRRFAHRSLGSLVEEYLESAIIKESTRLNYLTIWKRISRYISGSMLMESINYHTVANLIKSLYDKGLKSSTIRNDITFLSIIISYAKKHGYVTYRIDPFVGINWPNPEPRYSWLTVDEIKKIRDVELKNRRQIKCRDYFMLSYYLGGINMADLTYLNFNDCTETIRYVRKKTENSPKLNKYVEFSIPEEAIEIIDKYKRPDGLLSMTEPQRRDCMHGYFIRHLKGIAKITGIKNLIFYSARKSFSQHAFNLGINTCVIDFILGHRVDKGGTSLFSYISVSPEMATKAVRQVLDNLK